MKFICLCFLWHFYPYKIFSKCIFECFTCVLQSACKLAHSKLSARQGVAVNLNGKNRVLSPYNGTLTGQDYLRGQLNLDIQHGAGGDIFPSPEQDASAADVDGFAILPIRRACFSIKKRVVERKTPGAVNRGFHRGFHHSLRGYQTVAPYALTKSFEMAHWWEFRLLYGAMIDCKFEIADSRLKEATQSR